MSDLRQNAGDSDPSLQRVEVEIELDLKTSFGLRVAAANAGCSEEMYLRQLLCRSMDLQRKGFSIVPKCIHGLNNFPISIAILSLGVVNSLKAFM
jgi:hypothetical protein